MIRAGLLQHRISIERVATTQDAYGAIVETCSTIATRRAELVEQTITETQADSGTRTETTISLRLRWLDGVTLADRIVFYGRAFDLVEILEPARRTELEIKCRRIGP